MLLQVREFIYNKATPETADAVSRCCAYLNRFNVSVDEDLGNLVYLKREQSTDDLYYLILDLCCETALGVFEAHGLFFEKNYNELGYYNELLISLLDLQDVGELADELMDVLNNAEESDIEFRYFEMLNHLNPKLDSNPFNHGLTEMLDSLYQTTLEALEASKDEIFIEALDETVESRMVEMRQELKTFIEFVKGRDENGEGYIPEVPMIDYLLKGGQLGLTFDTYLGLMASTWEGLTGPKAAAQLWLMVHLSYEYGVERRLFQSDQGQNNFLNPEQMTVLLKDLAIIEANFYNFKKPANQGGL